MSFEASPTSRAKPVAQRASQQSAAAVPPLAQENPAWLWPNLLSLDAPLVAVLWQAMFVVSFSDTPDTFDFLTAALLALAVWLIYSADRTLDAWRGTGSRARHHFYRRHWPIVVPVWLTGLLTGGWLASTQLSNTILWDGFGLSVAVGLYFAVVHLKPKLLRYAGSKEAAVAVVFGLGTSLIVWPNVGTATDALAILLFSGLCWTNCAVIEDWEGHRAARGSILASSTLTAILATICLRDAHLWLACALVVSTLSILLLDRYFQNRLEVVSPEIKRVLADVALLSPLLLLPLALLS